ncbi:ABC transporter permease [Alteromonadaceae bacterium BrNp21-10]|nr:ABC transporter permease [Alteromonadaceae bacterium BrNp21-10]
MTTTHIPIIQNLQQDNDMAFPMSRLLRLYWLETLSEWRKTIRQPGFAIPALLFPVMFYIFFGVIFSQGTNTSSYMLVTYGVFGIVGPALFSFGVGMAVERGQGWMDLKQASPMPPSAQIIARVLVSMLFATIIIVSLFVIAYTLGGVRLALWQWMSLAFIFIAGSLPFCVIGLCLGLVLKANAAPAIVNLIYLPMSFLSGLWFPIDLFPKVMQNLANAFPPYHLAQLGLKIIDKDLGRPAWMHIASLLAFTLVFLLLTTIAYKRPTQD